MKTTPVEIQIRLIPIIAWAVFVLTYVGSPLNAATIMSSLPIISGGPVASLNQFNPALGTLTQVDFGLDLFADGVADFENPTFDSMPSFGWYDASATLSTPSGLVISSSVAGGVGLPAEGPGFFSDSFGEPSTGSDTFPAAPAYVGAGTFDVQLTSVGVIGGADPPWMFLGGDAFFEGTVTVTYTFDAVESEVPEPSTLTLVALGFLALIRRRRGV